MDETFEGLPGITHLVDDIIVTGRTQEEHDTNLRAMLERAAAKNLKLNPDKLTVGAQEVEYFGHIISADGLKPDPTKVKAIQDMPPPVDKKELQTMLGMINHLAKFAPQLSETTKPISSKMTQNSCGTSLSETPLTEQKPSSSASRCYRSSIQPSQSLYKWMQANTA